MQTRCHREGKLLCHLIHTLMLCSVVHTQVCSAVLDVLIFNGDLVQLLPKCCLRTRWACKSQVSVLPVQETSTNGIFRLRTLCSHCHTRCLSTQVLQGYHTKSASPKRHLQLTTFHVYRCSHAAMLQLDTHTWGLPQLPRDCKQSLWQLGSRCKVCSCAPGDNGQGRHL